MSMQSNQRVYREHGLWNGTVWHTLVVGLKNYRFVVGWFLGWAARLAFSSCCNSRCQPLLL